MFLLFVVLLVLCGESWGYSVSSFSGEFSGCYDSGTYYKIFYPSGTRLRSVCNVVLFSYDREATSDLDNFANDFVTSFGHVLVVGGATGAGYYDYPYYFSCAKNHTAELIQNDSGDSLLCATYDYWIAGAQGYVVDEYHLVLQDNPTIADGFFAFGRFKHHDISWFDTISIPAVYWSTVFPECNNDVGDSYALVAKNNITGYKKIHYRFASCYKPPYCWSYRYYVMNSILDTYCSYCQHYWTYQYDALHYAASSINDMIDGLTNGFTYSTYYHYQTYNPDCCFGGKNIITYFTFS